MKALIGICAAWLTILTLSSASAEIDLIQGPATVVDGDTIRIGDARIRLLGIDAPELAQTCTAGPTGKWPCGLKSKQQLQAHVAGKAVVCEANGRDRYGRAIAICRTEGRDAVDLNDVMVRSGYAIATPEYSDRYLEAEDEAKQSRRGLWAGSFQRPADYRRQNK